MIYLQEWTPTGKFKLITQQEFLVESLEVLMKRPMIHNKQRIEIPERSLIMIKTSIDTRRCSKDQVFEVKPNFLLTNEIPNLIIVPTMHIMQEEKHGCIPLVLISLNEDENIFLRKGEILGHLDPSSIEINEIVRGLVKRRRNKGERK